MDERRARDLDGAESPNNGWLVVILGVFALGWIRLMSRASWVGLAGVLGASVVMLWTAVQDWLDSRAVLDASAGLGLVLVVVAGRRACDFGRGPRRGADTPPAVPRRAGVTVH